MPTAPTAPALLSKDEAAQLLGVSSRTVDRWRQQYDLGEVHLTSSANPRFRRSTLEAGLLTGFNRKSKKK